MSFLGTGRGYILRILGCFIFVGIILVATDPTSSDAASQEDLNFEAARQKARERIHKETTLKKESITKEFTSKKSTIMAELESLYGAGKYEKVIEKSSPYYFIKDPDLIKIFNKAKEKVLLAKLKKTPATELEVNRSLYRQLLNISSQKKQYKEKLDYYEAKIQQREKKRIDEEKRRKARLIEEEKEHKARIATFGPRPKRVGFSIQYYSAVREYLQDNANDPSSIQFVGCTQIAVTDEGWLVGCVYRGKNAFGGLVKNANWFIIRNDRVVDIRPQTAFEWPADAYGW